MSDLMTIAQAAVKLNVSTATVCRMLRAGQLPRVPIGNRSVRIPTSAIKSAKPRATKVEKAVRAEIKKTRPQDLDSKIAKMERKLAKLRQQQMESSHGYVN